MKKRIVSLLLTLVMVLSLVPMSVFAADNHDGQVHVIVENTTYPEAEGAPWEGTLVEEWIDLNEDSTAMSCKGTGKARLRADRRREQLYQLHCGAGGV